VLTLSEISKAFGGRVLFSNASMQVNRGDRIGLVGPNGAGKSTLFRLILQEQEPDSGKVILDRRASLGYLPQESAPGGSETVLELAIAITPEVARLQQQLRSWENAHAVDTAEYHEAQVRYEALGGYKLEPRAKQILAGLSFRESDYARPARELSGGWIMRARLAQLLVQTPDLLLLDEPTNHLDLQSLLWFQDYLKSYPGGIVIISHDREFLNQLADTIVEIRQSRLCCYRGNYDQYLVQRDAQVRQLEAAYKNQQREIAHLMEFVDRFRAKNTKATQAQSKLKQIERMEKIEAPVNDEPVFKFQFPQPARSGQRVIELAGVAHAYGENWVYRDLNFEAERGQRLVLVGPNGAGKSTLLKLLAGVLPVQSGARELGYHVKSGYYSQNRVETLHLDRTVLEEGLDTPQRLTEQVVRTVLGSFGFPGDDVFKSVRVLSGGEKSRLALVRLLLDPPNLLLMDEPTTHLDMAGVEALVHALQQFNGTLIFISHDVYFIRCLANLVVRVNQGQLTYFKGDYQYYLDKTSALSEREALDASGQVPQSEMDDRPADRLREQRRQLVAQQNDRARRRRGQQNLVEKLESQIHELEKRQQEITLELQDPATYQKGERVATLNRELAVIHKRLLPLNTEWETAATKLAEIENEIIE
jgi:ATP-binding cassette, subfamily F, member 3